MAIFGVLLLMVSPILLVAALAVRFAGNKSVLNSIDYATVFDPVALNRWASNRLFLLPLTSFAFGIASLSRPVLGIIGCCITILSGALVIVWIAVGSDKFRNRR